MVLSTSSAVGYQINTSWYCPLVMQWLSDQSLMVLSTNSAVGYQINPSWYCPLVMQWLSDQSLMADPLNYSCQCSTTGLRKAHGLYYPVCI